MKIELYVKTEHLPQHTREDLVEWLKWELKASSSMRNDNPLTDCEIQVADIYIPYR